MIKKAKLIKNKLFITIVFFITIATIIFPFSLLAADQSGSTTDEINLSAPGNFSKLGEINSGNMIGGLINLIYIVSTISFFFVLLMGGVKWITSSGDEKKLTAARASITHGAIGLGIVFIAWALMNLIGSLFDFNPFKLQIIPFTNSSGSNSQSGSYSSGSTTGTDSSSGLHIRTNMIDMEQ